MYFNLVSGDDDWEGNSQLWLLEDDHLAGRSAARFPGNNGAVSYRCEAKIEEVLGHGTLSFLNREGSTRLILLEHRIVR